MEMEATKNGLFPGIIWRTRAKVIYFCACMQFRPQHRRHHHVIDKISNIRIVVARCQSVAQPKAHQSK